LGDPLVELLVRPPASLTAYIPGNGFHRLAPRKGSQFRRHVLFPDSRARRQSWSTTNAIEIVCQGS
jgi:hypothetical protein